MQTNTCARVWASQDDEYFKTNAMYLAIYWQNETVCNIMRTGMNSKAVDYAVGLV